MGHAADPRFLMHAPPDLDDEMGICALASNLRRGFKGTALRALTLTLCEVLERSGRAVVVRVGQCMGPRGVHPSHAARMVIRGRSAPVPLHAASTAGWRARG